MMRQEAAKKTYSMPRVAPQISNILIKLLQGFVYRDETKIWNTLVTYEAVVRDYVANINLRLHLHHEDGYAFLSQSNREGANEEPTKDDDTDDLKGARSLVRKIPLSFDVTLLCVLLRESLEQYDAGTSDDHRLILSREDIYELIRTFLPQQNDEIKYRRKVDATIKKVTDLGFLKSLSVNSNRFEVRRTIKALIDAACLRDIKKLMQADLEAVTEDRKGALH